MKPEEEEMKNESIVRVCKTRNARRFYQKAISIGIVKRAEINMHRPPKMFLKE